MKLHLFTVFVALLPFRLFTVKTFSAAPCCQTPSVYIPPLMSETRMHTNTKPQAKIVLYNLILGFLAED
jgi:hypothetical protein